MNKSAIKEYSIWARNELISQVTQRAFEYGISKEDPGDPRALTVGEMVLTPTEQAQRRDFIKKINTKSFDQAVEEVAYTWFNRFIALRFMEVNHYLPSKVRVFSDADNNFSPEILKEVLNLDFDKLDKEKVHQHLENNDSEALYRYLLLIQCNDLNRALPQMFEKMGSYTELLLPKNILREESVLGRLVLDIPEEDWLEGVEIIGWMYQYYNSQPKDETYALLKKNQKVTKERIPYVTQIFTPEWIVKYMVENSLGRLWLDGHPNDKLRENWIYYLDEAEQEEEVERDLQKIREEHSKIKPEEIRLIDPAMGSGHILVYAFDLLLQIYESEGWSAREAAQSILKNNLYGLDIDDRAAQLAYFAIMMKARQHDRKIFSRGINPNLYSIKESNHIHQDTISYFIKGDGILKVNIESILTEIKDAKIYGSIIPVTEVNFGALYKRFKEIEDESDIAREEALAELLPLAKAAELMSKTYDVVITNPPYMGSSGMDSKLNEYVRKHYPDSKSDLFAVFMERCRDMTRHNKYLSMITMHSWMFLKSFENLRKSFLDLTILNMVHLGAHAFAEIGGEVVQATSFNILKNNMGTYKGTYSRLVNPTSEDGKKELFLKVEKRYISNNDIFCLIPGSPVAYWASSNLLESFEEGVPLDSIASPRQGLATADNNRFLRLWWEVSKTNMYLYAKDIEESVGSNAKWFPYNKGGAYRKWYGNNDHLVNWEKDGFEIRNFRDTKGNLRSVTRNPSYYFRESITWSKVSSGNIAFRYKPYGHIFDVAGTSVFSQTDRLNYLQGLCNSKVMLAIIDLISPTLNYEVGHIASIPVIDDENSKDFVDRFVDKNISLSKSDWDAFETSWDFKKHPLI